MTSPSPRKARNAKGLALKLGIQDPSLQISAPASPAAFVKPPLPKPRRKPSNLSLQTTSNFNSISLRPLAAEPPPTPSIRLTSLHHAASMSQLGISSPDPRGFLGPQGGMRLPTFERSQVSGLSNAFRKPVPIMESTAIGSEDKIEEEAAPIRTQLATRSGGDIGGDAFDCAANEDAKSPGYPEGPIAIYEPYVFLYLEPSAEEASRFDVVMNVASEVKNPFKDFPAPEERKDSVSLPWSTFDSMDIDRDNIPEPMTAASIATFKTAFEVQPMDTSATPTDTSPTTPKPPSTQPEYIHIPWEHNTDITKDLMGLCEIIDDRVNKGKKVLVHCQQGASRSASLIIAYGMYRNPSLTVDAAYNAAQARSKYISPNINLMYALQDFRKTVQFRAPKTGRSPAKHRMALSVDEIHFPSKEPPQTAPLPSETSGRAISPSGTPPHARGNSTPNLRDISPGPSSAPSSFAWPSFTDRTTNADSWSISPSKPDLGNFDFLQPRKYSPKPQPSVFTPQAAIDTPPNSQPASPPSTQGFSAHRDGHAAKRKPAPTLSFKPAHPLRPAPSLPSLNALGSIRPQFTAFALQNVPETPGLWSPRVQAMATHSFGFAPVPAPPLQQQDDDEAPPTPSIMSPRVADFGINPFAEMFSMDAAAGLRAQLGGGGGLGLGVVKKRSFVFERARVAEKPLPPLPRVDPRSPAMKGESVIVRSIDEVL